MNERIRELAEQCTYRYESSDSSGEYETFDKEKFAELIVKECVSIVADAVDHREPASTYVGKMKHHFGVEE